MIDQSFQAKKRPKPTHKRQTTTTIGKFGENIAVQYLQQKGYELLKQNFHIQGGELDIIMQKNGIIIFVEVKLRTGKNFGEGFEAITFSKKQKLLRTIFTFLRNEKSTREKPIKQWQLDLVSIHFNSTKHTAQIQHFQNILEA